MFNDISQITLDEEALLLFLESRASNSGGLVDTARMTTEGLALAQQWDKAGFIEFNKNPPGHRDPQNPLDYWVILTDRAWEVAAALRRKRAERGGTRAKKYSEITKRIISMTMAEYSSGLAEARRLGEQAGRLDQERRYKPLLDYIESLECDPLGLAPAPTEYNIREVLRRLAKPDAARDR